MTLFKNKVFVVVTKMRPLGWSSVQYDCCPKRRRHRDRHAQREDNMKTDHVRMETEIGMLHLHIKGCQTSWQHQKLREKHGADSLLVPSEKAWLCQHVDFAIFVSRTMTE